MGMPAFNPPLRFAKPLLPNFSRVFSRLEPLWKEGNVTKGPLTLEFENAVSKHLGVKHITAVSNCTVGLIMALKALGLTGTCLVPSFTFTSTVQALLWNNLKPIFVDIHPTKLTVDIRSLEDSFASDTSCVLVPYVFGNPPPLDEVKAFCEKKKIPLIVDSAHAFGSLYKGMPAGQHGTLEVFSTSATKLLCTGEGGIVATPDEVLDEKIKTLREYGHLHGYETKLQGLNGRMTELQASMGLEGLPLVEEHAKRRNALAEHYKQVFGALPIAFQEIEPNSVSSYKDFAILLENEWGLTRDETAALLEKEGIPTKKYFLPLHLQPFFSKHSAKQKPLPTTEKIAQKILCLPIFWDLKEMEIKKIGEVFREIYQKKGSKTKAVQ
jgi:dTDP-4-amino-4,6-dideoxygalactose transaminase